MNYKITIQYLDNGGMTVELDQEVLIQEVVDAYFDCFEHLKKISKDNIKVVSQKLEKVLELNKTIRDQLGIFLKMNLFQKKGLIQILFIKRRWYRVKQIQQLIQQNCWLFLKNIFQSKKRCI